MQNKKLALVIGWGSAKCVAALGLMRVLKRESIKIDMLVGGGGGSIYAALLALGYEVDALVDIHKRLWTHEITSKPNRRAILELLFPRLFKTKRYFNLLDDKLVNERLQLIFGEATFADTVIPLYVAATDHVTGKQVVISSGSIYEAVRASIALPLIFPPFEKDNRLLSDGYLSDPLPIGVAMREGAEVILALGFEAISGVKIEAFKDYVLHMADILSNNLQEASIAFYNLAHHGALIPIIPKFNGDIGLFEMHKTEEIIRAGEAATEHNLPDIHFALEGISS